MTSQDDAARPVSRRAIMKTVALGLAAAATGTLVSRAQAQTKKTKAEVKYQDHPNGSADCGGCHFFLAPSGCQLVQGTISPIGWCTLFKPAA